jgi:hypothetical protein
MNIVNSANATKPDAYALANYQSTRLIQSSVDIQTSAGISLVTADGDKVTLSASSALQASLQTYDYLGRTQRQTVAAHGENFQLSSASGFAVTVDGTLDQQELADINKLLDAIASSSKKFLAGKIENGLDQLAKIDDLDSIASFEANFSYSRQASATSTTQVSTTDPAPSSSATDIASSTAASSPQGADSFINQLAQAVQRLNSENGDERIPKRFAQLFKKLADRQPLNTREQTLIDRIRSEHSKRSLGHHNNAPTPALS